MATHIVDINSYTAGANLIGNGWTNPITRAGTTFTAQGTSPNKYMRISANTAGTKIFGYDAVQGENEIEILVKFRLSSDYGKQGAVALRYTGSSEATTAGYATSGSFISSAGQLAIDEGATGYLFWAPWNYLPNITYWIRMRVSGNNQYAKVWTDGSAEPAGWTTAGTDSHKPSGTYNGLHTYSINNTSPANVDYYWVSFGTGGEQAPSALNSITQIGNARIEKPQTLDQHGNARIQRTFTLNQTGNAQIRRTLSLEQHGNAQIRRTFTLDQHGSAHIEKVNQITQIGNATLESYYFVASITQVGNARIQKTLQITQIGNALIEHQNQLHQHGNALIEHQNTIDQHGNARIGKINTIEQHGNALIERVNTLLQIGNARIQKTFTLEQHGNARISNPVPDKRPQQWENSDEKVAAEWQGSDKTEQEWNATADKPVSEWQNAPEKQEQQWSDSDNKQPTEWRRQYYD